MSKQAKIWLIIAVFLVLIGCIIFGGAMKMLKWDFTKLSTAKYETNEYEIDEDYINLSILTDTADIKFMPSENLKSSVVCYEQKNVKHSVAVKNGTLEIKVVDTRKWYEHIGIFFTSPKITVYIPQGKYGTLSLNSSTGDIEIPKDFKFESIDILNSTGAVTNYASVLESIKIRTSTGSICVKSISARALDLSVSTGKVTVSDVICEADVKINVSTGKANIINTKCKSVISSGSTGDIYLSNVIAKEKFFIERNTGDVKLDGCDADEIFLETDTGDITGSLLTDKVFIAQSDTGSVNVPKTVNGGRCEITTDTGDIEITID